MKKYELAIKKTYKEDNENLFKSKKNRGENFYNCMLSTQWQSLA